MILRLRYKQLIFISFLLLFGSLKVVIGQTTTSLPNKGLILEDFSSSKIGKFPRKWQQRKKGGEKVYRVSQEKKQGKRFLQAIDRGKSVQIFSRVKWDINKYPLLNWQWRAHKLPQGAREDKKELNDSVAALYVVFPRHWFVPRVLKYVWSTTLPVGTEIKSGGKTWVIVKASGEKDLKRWLNFKANAKEDFKRLFKLEEQNPIAIGFLTDANATKDSAMADYGAITISSK